MWSAVLGVGSMESTVPSLLCVVWIEKCAVGMVKCGVYCLKL